MRFEWQKTKEDCIFYAEKADMCYALNEVFCHNEECSFYKCKDEWVLSAEGHAKRRIKSWK